MIQNPYACVIAPESLCNPSGNGFCRVPRQVVATRLRNLDKVYPATRRAIYISSKSSLVHIKAVRCLLQAKAVPLNVQRCSRDCKCETELYRLRETVYANQSLEHALFAISDQRRSLPRSRNDRSAGRFKATQRKLL